MNRLIAGNILGLVGSTIMTFAGVVKDKKYLLLVMCVQYVFLGSANFCLGAYSAVVTCCCGLCMSILTLNQRFNTKMKILFSAAEIAFIIIVNKAGIVGLLPLLPVLMVIWTLDVKNAAVLKTAVAAGMVLWAVYDFSYKNYTTFCFDIITFVSNLVGIYRIYREKKAPQKN